jgi:hypothetical protein
MSDFIREFSKNNKPQFLKYKKYLENNNWTEIKTKADEEESEKGALKYKQSECDLQHDLISNVIERLKYFVKKAHGDRNTPVFKTFTKFCLEVIEIHLERIDYYVNSIDISDIENQDLRAGEVKFLKECFSKATKINDDISALNIKEDSVEGSIVEFRENEKAPLIMHEILVKEYPELQLRLDSMGIDFKSKPKQQMMCTMENVPQWNKEKHYWEQDKETLQFYVDEFKKLRDGVKIDGVYFSGWMYFHLNIFNASYPITFYNEASEMEETKDTIGIPPLRDNEWFIIQVNYEKAKRTGKMMFLAATRRAAKTTIESSHLDYCVTMGKAKILCVAGATKDLGQLESKLKVSQSNKNTAFRVPLQVDEWKDQVIYGLKKKNGKTILSSTIDVINLEKGGQSSSEKLAGFTPDAVVIDEIMKLPFKDQLAALKPALDQPGGKRCVVILSGTAGNEALAKDAFTVLSDPATNDILEMDWETLERMAGDYVTWKRRPFGTFIPGQMSAKEKLVKLESNLAEYLKKPNATELKKIKIQVTDWKEAKRIIDEDREKKKKDRKEFIKEKLYFPIDPEEMLLSSKTSPFPTEDAILHLDRIRAQGNIGKKVDLVKVDGKIQAPFSDKYLPKFPHQGGFHDSPVVLFEELPEIKPPRGLYVCALDDYKQEQADSESLGCFIIYKRQSGGDEWGDRIVAIYTSRPDPHNKFHRWGYMLIESFNAECLMENEDMEFKLYLDSIRKTDEYLVPSFNVAGDLSIKNNNRRTYGISPNGNKSAIINKVVNYCKEPLITGEKDENGVEIIRLGVERINDEMLLEEIINYREGENHDRITTFGIALIQAHKMDADFIEARLTEREYKKDENRVFNKNVLGVSRARGLLGSVRRR